MQSLWNNEWQGELACPNTPKIKLEDIKAIKGEITTITGALKGSLKETICVSIYGSAGTLLLPERRLQRLKPKLPYPENPIDTWLCDKLVITETHDQWQIVLFDDANYADGPVQWNMSKKSPWVINDPTAKS